jgi:hypothetical protein
VGTRPEPSAEALRFVLALQQARALQLRTYSLESLSRPDNLSHGEAQALVLAGVLLSQNRGFAGRGSADFKGDIERGLRLSSRLQGPPPLIQAAPALAQRRRLVLLGAQAGTFYTAVWNCLKLPGEPRNPRLVERVTRQIRGFQREVPGLPRFEAEDCRAEDLFDWSLEVSRAASAAPPADRG